MSVLNNYLHLQDTDEVIAYSAKAGQTTIHKMYSGRPCKSMTGEQALASGLPVTLYHRCPLDRLVSGYSFFKKGKFRDTHMHQQNPRAHNILFHVGGESSFEDWCRATKELDNVHWCRQYESHCVGDVFVPSVVKDISQLGAMRLNKSERGKWEDYFTPDLLEEMSEYHHMDLSLHTVVMAAGGTYELS